MYLHLSITVWFWPDFGKLLANILLNLKHVNNKQPAIENDIISKQLGSQTKTRAPLGEASNK